MTDEPQLPSEWNEHDPAQDTAGEPLPDKRDGHGAAGDVSVGGDGEPAGAELEHGDVESGGGQAPAAGLVFASIQDWVDGYLLVMYRRAVSGTATTWCAQWWRHPEAVVRLQALWRAWEYLRLEPAMGMSVWLRDHCDQHMAQLLSADGPFKGCKPAQHSQRPLEPLPSTPAPAGWLERSDRAGLPAATGVRR